MSWSDSKAFCAASGSAMCTTRQVNDDDTVANAVGGNVVPGVGCGGQLRTVLRQHECRAGASGPGVWMGILRNGTMQYFDGSPLIDGVNYTNFQSPISVGSFPDGMCAKTLGAVGLLVAVPCSELYRPCCMAPVTLCSPYGPVAATRTHATAVFSHSSRYLSLRIVRRDSTVASGGVVLVDQVYADVFATPAFAEYGGGPFNCFKSLLLLYSIIFIIYIIILLCAAGSAPRVLSVHAGINPRRLRQPLFPLLGPATGAPPGFTALRPRRSTACGLPTRRAAAPRAWRR